MDDAELQAALTEAHAPLDEPATSADELDEDDEAVCLLSSLSSLHPGAWVVLHGLVRKPELIGRVCVLIGQNDGDADRWDCHMLLEGRPIAVKPDNLSVVAPCTWKSAGEWRREEMDRTEAVVRGVLESFVASGATELEFPAALSGEARNKVHAVCGDLGLQKESSGAQREGER